MDYSKKNVTPLKFYTSVKEYTEEAFTLFKSIVPLRPSAYDNDLDRLEEEFLRFYLKFGGPVHNIYQHTLQYYREKFGETLVFNMAYQGSRKAELWGTVFDALHNEPTTENMGKLLDSFLSSRTKKRFNRHELYLQKLPPLPIYPRYYIYRQIHQITINYCQSLHEKIVGIRTSQRAANLSMKIGGATWTSDAENDSWGNVWGHRILSDSRTYQSDGPTFVRLSTQPHIAHFFELASRVNWLSESEKGPQINPRKLVFQSQTSYKWMMAVYNISKAMKELHEYKLEKKLSSAEWTLVRFQKAYNLLIGLEDGIPFGWDYTEERKMVTYVLAQIAWLFRDLKEWSNAELYERFYVESWKLYPDDEFAWLEEHDLDRVEAWRKDYKTDLPMPDRGSWDAERKRRREAWERKYFKPQNTRRPSASNANQDAPQNNSRTSEETADPQARRRQLRSLFDDPLSTWTTRQDAVDSPVEFFTFLEWLFDKYKPPDARRYARFTELLRLQREAGSREYRKLCRSVVQIYHPDSNVLEDVTWQETAQEITKVILCPSH